MMGRPLLVARGTPAALARTAVDVNPVCVSVSMNLNRSFTQPWPLVTPSTRVAVTPRSAAGGTSGSGADDLAASAATRGVGGSASERSESEIHKYVSSPVPGEQRAALPMAPPAKQFVSERD